MAWRIDDRRDREARGRTDDREQNLRTQPERGTHHDVEPLVLELARCLHLGVCQLGLERYVRSPARAIKSTTRSRI